MGPNSRTGRTDPLNPLATPFAEHYVLGEEIGHGASAVVYRGRDLKRQRDVAIKVLRRELASSIGSERFQREVQIAAGLTHPHILPILDSGDADGMLFYVMPLLDGEALRARMKRERQLSVEDALQITRDVASGLQYAHDRGIVHRDVKPENILIAGQTSNATGGDAFLADFGLARLVVPMSGDSLTSSGIAVGTIAYMSPEQSTGIDSIDVRTDQYSLACVLFEMLAGVPPYQGVDARAVIARHRLDPIPRIRHTRDSIPAEIDDVIARAMAKVPADRFKSVGAFVQALDAAASSDMIARMSDGRAHRISAQRRNTAEASSVERLPEGFRWPLDLVRDATRALARITWRRAAAIGGILVAGVLTLTLVQNRMGRVNLDPNLVAITPFEAPDPALSVWREGMVDLLSRTLDGAGPLRTVPVTTVLKTGAGTSDRQSARALARRSGAGLAVFGVIAHAGVDSVWVAVRVLDVVTDRIVADVEITDALSRIGRWQGELAMSALKQLAAVRPVGSAPIYSLGSASLPALKAFLQGEQQFRRTAFDSAALYYEQAIAVDSLFALPFHRLFGLQVWQLPGINANARVYALRAGALNHGLPPRDSLLVVADSLSAAYPASSYGDSAYWTHARRLLGALDQAARRYPEDPEVWYSLALAQFTYGQALGYSSPGIAQVVDRSIRLDSSFAPAYLSGILLAGRNGDEPALRRYARAYLKHGPAGAQADAIKLMFALVGADEAQRKRLIESASDAVLFGTYNKISWSTDSSELAVQIARDLVRRSHSASPTDSMIASFDLGFALAWRGHVAAAYKATGNQASRLFGSLVLLDGVPRDTAAQVFQKLLNAPLWPPTQLPMAISWWSKQRDTISLLAVVRRAEEAAQSQSRGLAGEYSRWLANSARAHLSLIRRDTVAAIDRFKALPDTACPACFADRILLAELLIGARRLQEAEPLLRKDLADRSAQNNPLFVLWELERGRLAERQGDSPNALAHYRLVEEAWSQADPGLRWAVDSARLGRTRLARR